MDDDCHPFFIYLRCIFRLCMLDILQHVRRDNNCMFVRFQKFRFLHSDCMEHGQIHYNVYINACLPFLLPPKFLIYYIIKS